VAWAASRIFVTRTDRDTYEFNFPEVLGNSVSAAAANAYYSRNRTLRDNADRLGEQLVSDTISNCLKEFWPDIKRALPLGPCANGLAPEANRTGCLLQHTEPGVGHQQRTFRRGRRGRSVAPSWSPCRSRLLCRVQRKFVTRMPPFRLAVMVGVPWRRCVF